MIKTMSTIKISTATKKKPDLKMLQSKAAILDELLEIIEDKYFGHLMSPSEKEKNISLSKAQKLLR